MLVIDSLGSGGAQNQLVLLAKGLMQRGVKTSVFTYQKGDFFKVDLMEEGVDLIHKQKSGKLGISVIRRLAKEIKIGRYTNVISFLDTPNFYALTATTISGIDTINIASYRSASNFDRMSFLKAKMYQWINSAAKHLVSNSNHERARWIAKTTALQTKFHTIYNGIGVEVVSGKTAHSEKVRKILLVGKLRAPKNADLLISVLEKKNFRDIEVHWYGGTTFPNVGMQEYADSTKRRTEDLNVKWFWHPPTSEIKQLYKDFDVLVHPSILEGLPNVICEAMMAGLPVLASRVLDHPYLLNNDDRLLFDPKSEEELNQKLKDFMSISREGREEISNQLSSRAKSLFDIDTMVDSYLNLLKKDRA